jgi:hypothetical protein
VNETLREYERVVDPKYLEEIRTGAKCAIGSCGEGPTQTVPALTKYGPQYRNERSESPFLLNTRICKV